jgi:hypothetical protein
MEQQDNIKLPYFPAERPEGMGIEEFKEARNNYQKLIKMHKRLGYDFGHKGGQAYNLRRQVRKYEQEGWAATIKNEKDYMELYQKIYDMAKGSLNP